MNFEDSSGRTALHFAAAGSDSVDILQLLLNNGAEANSQSRGGETPLMKAIASNKSENVKFLLENGANPALQNACGRSSYDFAEAS